MSLDMCVWVSECVCIVCVRVHVYMCVCMRVHVCMCVLYVCVCVVKAEAYRIPNLTHPLSPRGGEDQARLLRVVGEKPVMTFAPKDHVELGAQFDLFDFEAGSRVSGSHIVYLKNEGELAVSFSLSLSLSLSLLPNTGCVEARAHVMCVC